MELKHATADTKPQPDPYLERYTIFISHSSKDDQTVKRLRRVLQAEGYAVLEDATAFDVTDRFPAQIAELIDRSNRFIVLVSEHSIASEWVHRETQYALKSPNLGVKKIIPILLPGAETTDLGKIDCEDIIALKAEGTREIPNLGIILPELKYRLHGKAFDAEAEEKREQQNLAELVLEIIDPFIDEENASQAYCQLHFYDSEASEPSLSSEPFWFTPPLGVIENSEIRFYLERYYLTPFGEFTKRKERIEKAFSKWGGKLHDALGPDANDEIFTAWEHANSGRRFTIRPPKPPRKIEDRKNNNPQNHPVVAEIFSLPWELLHNGTTFFFKIGKGARVRRCLPGAWQMAESETDHTKPPLRVLIVCPRPEAENIHYFDHRVSVRPLVEALESLGDLAEWTILAPATFSNLRETLNQALDADKPFHIVHFNGHGIYDKETNLGQLIFEAENDSAIRNRKAHSVNAEDLGAEISEKGVRLFFVEACESAKSGPETDSSVAACLITAGIPSVVAMSHSVFVETARQFASVFYPAIVRGCRVGAAMLAGQRLLANNRMRDPRIPLELDDWFVPILFQYAEDEPVLNVSPPPEKIQQELAKHRTLYLGEIPPTPEHGFIGRSRQMLEAERLLVEHDVPWILFRGGGGEGKTTIAAELARWLVQSRRNQFPRAAFASVEFVNDLQAILIDWGEQLRPGQFVARADSLEAAEEFLIEVLNDWSAVLILDNLESILPAPGADPDEIARTICEDQQFLLPRIQKILSRCPGTKLILTSREMPPEDSGYCDADQTIELGRLAKSEAIEVVAHVLAKEAKKRGQQVEAHNFEIENEDEIAALVDQVGCHARAIVLLTPELWDKGLKATSDELAEIMREMNEREGADRETSLMASMELSLRRLDPAMREKILPLGVFHRGGNSFTMAEVARLATNETDELIKSLETKGLGENLSTKPTYLRFDPALAPALLHELRQTDPEGESEARDRWIEAYRELAGLLYQQQTEETYLVYQLTRLELPNFLAALEVCAALNSAKAESLIIFASNLEALLAPLNLPSGLAQVVAIRELAAKELPENTPWSKAAFEARRQAIERCWAASQQREALGLSQDLVAKTEAAGPQIYPNADYDMALAQWTAGRSFRNSGQIDIAFEAFENARAEFERIAEERLSKTASGMASKCLTEQADCLVAGRKLDYAAELYEERIKRGKSLDDPRGVAVALGQLGMCRMYQKRYGEAIRLHYKALDQFKVLDEPASVAISWHQIGTVYNLSQQFEDAEKAFLQSLSFWTQSEKHKAQEGDTRDQLGHLYRKMPDRLEDSVVFSERAAKIYSELDDLQKEGFAQNNLALSLMKLQRHDEARTAYRRAIECLSDFGHHAAPWKIFNNLADLEREIGNGEEATQAKERAVRAYADARREGWEETFGHGAQLCESIFHLLTRESEGIPQVKQQMRQLASQPGKPNDTKALITQILRLFDGVRDESLWQHPDLYYADAAELLLLLEKLERDEIAEAPDLHNEQFGPQITPELCHQLAQRRGLDLSAMSSEDQIAFIGTVIAVITNQDPNTLNQKQHLALIKAAEAIAEEL